VLLYGLDQTAIEKQILGSNFTPTQKQRVLKKLNDPANGQIWLQFLRLPMNFDLISEIMAEQDSTDIPRVPSEVVGRFVKRRLEDKGVNPTDSEYDQTILSRMAAALVTDVTRRSRPFRSTIAQPPPRPAKKSRQSTPMPYSCGSNRLRKPG
jgi:hypothetical protein